MARYDVTPAEVDPGDARVAIAAARFNQRIVDRLLAAALATLREHGLGDERVLVARVPGAFELPLAADRLAARQGVEAVIALGAVIRGDTPHFDYVCAECARGIAAVSLARSLPVVFGVLTTDDEAQAEARAGGAHGNKGAEAALAALEMITLLRRLGEP